MNNITEIVSLLPGFTSFTLIGISFLGGVIASLAPCSLAILPLILAYVCGVSESGYTKLFLRLLSFSLGLSSVLGIIGLLCALTGKVFGGFDSPILLLLFASFLVVMGLSLIGFVEVSFPNIVKKIPQSESTGVFVYPFLIGVLFAFLASPCSSPILAAVLASAAVSSDYLLSFLMLFAFAFGQCIIVILAGLFASFLKNLKKLQNFTDILVKFSGYVFVFIGFVIWYYIFAGLF